MRSQLAVVITLGIALRALLFSYTGLQAALSTRPELVTAVSSFHRVREGVFLSEHVGTPYAGDVFHQPPLVFALFYPFFKLPEHSQYIFMSAFFIGVDVLIALGIARWCTRLLQLEEGFEPVLGKERIWLEQIPVSPLVQPKLLPIAGAAIYLFNPYSLASTLAMSTSSLTHLHVLYALIFAAEGATVASCICIAIGSYLSVYPVFLLVGITLVLEDASLSKQPHKLSWMRSIPFNFGKFSLLLVITAMWVAFLMFISHSMIGDWSFVQQTYVWVAKYSDLTPNIGIFWYFFIEVFDRFIPYFLCILHIHPLIYIAPIFLRLHNRPQAYYVTLVGIFMLFQAYPTFGDFGFFITLIFMFPKTIMTMTSRYVFALGMLVATCMLPVMWFLWLFPASGNANFFYNQTLVYQAFNSLIISSFVNATMKREKNVLNFVKKHQTTELGRKDA